MARHVADLSLTQRRGSMKCKAPTASRRPGLYREWPASRFAICERKRNYRPNGERRPSALYRHRSRTSNYVSANFRNVSLHYNDRDDSNSLCVARAYLMPQSIMRRLVATQLLNVQSSTCFQRYVKNVKPRVASHLT